MRATIKRTKACEKLLSKVQIDVTCYYDQEYWLKTSKESFHGVKSEDGETFVFMDQRLPDFMKLPVKMVEIEQ